LPRWFQNTLEYDCQLENLKSATLVITFSYFQIRLHESW
jgi:hypothetical protein